MKTDETNLPKDPPSVDRRLAVGSVAGATAAHVKSSAERDSDTMESWRRSSPRERRRMPRDPVELHGFDLEKATPATRRVISSFSADLAEVYEALDKAEHQLERALEARRTNPFTGLMRADVFMTEIDHLEYLDRQEGEGVHSSIAVYSVPGLTDLKARRGRAAAERIAVRIGRILADAVAPSEPACRIGDTDFAVLLTALSGKPAEDRAHALARVLQKSLDDFPDRFAPHDRIAYGFAMLESGKSALETIDAADVALRTLDAEVKTSSRSATDVTL
ncbi:diguanylate cyclase [Rhodospirillaceae bacterium KN72]|uniref:Diguanylate cyclase n=1 Tax=Pacificispira spongiicola TaxID=2729598 RepID=A0A7Y0DY99_9PROT|nr:diguanylate cyclase [Pacificispira spongiicola]NMM43798.1 diguanylate cyclase [Pacificispira spongiicola]